jgi:hypothetical protein
MTIQGFLLAQADRIEARAQRWKYKPNVYSLSISPPMVNTKGFIDVEVELLNDETRWVDTVIETLNYEQMRERYYDPDTPDPDLLADAVMIRDLVVIHQKRPEGYPEKNSCCSTCSAHGEYPYLGWPCPTLKAVARRFAGQDDYDKTWDED